MPESQGKIAIRLYSEVVEAPGSFNILWETRKIKSALWRNRIWKRYYVISMPNDFWKKMAFGHNDCCYIGISDDEFIPGKQSLNPDFFDFYDERGKLITPENGNFSLLHSGWNFLRVGSKWMEKNLSKEEFASYVSEIMLR